MNSKPREGVREPKARYQNMHNIPDETVYAMMLAITVSVLLVPSMRMSITLDNKMNTHPLLPVRRRQSMKTSAHVNITSVYMVVPYILVTIHYN